MKIIVPEFLLSTVRADACDLLETCEFIAVDDDGAFTGDLEGAEILVLPWGIPDATQERLLSIDSLQWIHLVSAGVDHALGERLCAMDVLLTNASGVFDLPIAETVLTYILMIAKRMPTFLKQQRERTWRKHRLREVAGLTVGIIGAGSIGTEVARLCQALDLRVIGTRRHPERGAPHVDELLPTTRMDDLLAQSDFVVVAVPLTEETRGMIDATAFRQMRADAWFINVARGAVVDQGALIAALQAGQIGGAALDVFVEEPLPVDSPLWELDNVILTPHNSWSTPHVARREAALFLKNLRRYLRDEPLCNVVDRSLGY